MILVMTVEGEGGSGCSAVLRMGELLLIYLFIYFYFRE